MTNHTPPQILSFGCRLNHHESAILRQELENSPHADNLVIINSCAVTASAESEIKRTIQKYHREYPDKKIIVTGCSAQINKESYKKLKGVSAVWGNGEKIQAKNILAQWHGKNQEPEIIVSDIMKLRQLSPHFLMKDDTHTRGFLEIQNGCDHRCTFCVIPYGRGNSRSHPLPHILTAVEKLLLHGFKEIVLTGVDIASWRSPDDGQKKLPYLIKSILQHCPDLPRLRLSSLDPAEMTDELWEVFATEPRLLPHIHLSLQAGCDMILKRMKRRHSVKDIETIVKKARQLSRLIVFGADIMAGFPTESDAMFKETAELIKKIPIIFGHVFPYSERPFTPAGRIKKQIPIKTRKERARILREICQGNLYHWQKQQINQQQNILIEQYDQSYFGHNEEFCKVRILADERCHMVGGGKNSLINHIIPVKIIGREGDSLIATAI